MIDLKLSPIENTGVMTNLQKRNAFKLKIFSEQIITLHSQTFLFLTLELLVLSYILWLLVKHIQVKKFTP